MKVLVAGDFCPRDRVSDIIEKDGGRLLLKDIQALTQSADLSIVNFECCIADKDATPIVKEGPNLRTTPKSIKLLSESGFNLVTLANNHFYDYGDKGVIETLEYLRKYGINYVGGGKNIIEASKVFYFKQGNETISIINCCEHEFTIASQDRGGANPLDAIQQWYSIQEAKCNSNYVIIVVHGGHEHCQYPSERMMKTYRFFIDSGADAVINHHQHCYSGYEVYKGKPIFYGLGNFCFDKVDGRKSIWNEGYLVSLELSNANVGFEIIPYVQCDEKPGVFLMDEKRKKEFDNKINSINNNCDNPSKHKDALLSFYDNNEMPFRHLLMPYSNRYLKSLERRGLFPSLISKKKLTIYLNFIDCESHRDRFIYFLNKIIKHYRK